MAIIRTEGFDLIGSNAELLQRGWDIAEPGSIATTVNQYGGRAWDLGTTDDFVLAINTPKTIATEEPYISVACWRLYTTIPGAASGAIIQIGDGIASVATGLTNSAHVYLQNAVNGGIRVSRANNVLVETLAARIKANVWQHYELRVFVDNAVGTLEFWLDGIKEIDLTGVDTKDSGGTGNISFTGNNDPSNCYIDDIVIAQDATTELPQIGLHRIHTLLPDGNGTNTAWTGTATDVDDPFGASDGDSTFASESVVNDKQDYTFGNLSESPASVLSVTLVTEARKDDAGTVGLTPFLLSNAVEGAGAENGLAEAYGTTNDIFELNPDGAVVWTETTINALQAGHEITT